MAIAMMKQITLTVILMGETVVELASTKISALIVIVLEELLVMVYQIFWLAMASVIRRPITKFATTMALTVVDWISMKILVMVIKSPNIPQLLSLGLVGSSLTHIGNRVTRLEI
jgi:hypothetical protein